MRQEAVIKQPAVYYEEGPAFQSYDGGIQNYQNLIPVPKAQGVYLQEPLIEAPKQLNVLPQTYVQEPLLSPKAAGLFQDSSYALPEHTYPGAYRQQVYQQPIASLPASQPGVTYEQNLPSISYEAPLEQSRIAYEQPIQTQKVALPAYENNEPISSYQLEQAFGEPHNLLVSQPKYVSHPYGVSSQNYEGSTGNFGGDDGSLNYGEEPLSYKYKRNSN